MRGNGWEGNENGCVAVSCRLPERSAQQASVQLLYVNTVLPPIPNALRWVPEPNENSRFLYPGYAFFSIYSSKNFTNISLITIPTNYFTILQGRCHRERNTMSTLRPF